MQQKLGRKTFAFVGRGSIVSKPRSNQGQAREWQALQRKQEEEEARGLRTEWSGSPPWEVMAECSLVPEKKPTTGQTRRGRSKG
jgi:hypothetical protein